MRLRVAMSLAVLALLVLLSQSVAMILLLDEKEEEFIENQISDQIEHSMAIWPHAPAAAFPNTRFMRLFHVSKEETGAAVPAVFAHLKVGNHEIHQGGKEFHVAVRENDSGRYILAYDVDGHESRLNSLMLLTISASVLLGALTLFAGYRLAGRLTGRLERLARRVGDDAPGSLVEPGMERELFAVAEALDLSRQRQSAMLERERAFAANLSHELRTPLTGIRTDAEMLAALPDVGNLVSRRANRIVSSVDRINTLATSLLLLAREAGPGRLEPVRLKAAIESIWASLLLANPKGLVLQLEMSETAMVKADPALFDLVLRNLLDNALRYSEAGSVVCRLVAGQLTVHDAGPGFAEADLAHIFDRFFIGARGGNGIGLALVRHICSANGWMVGAANAPGGGGEVSIDLGASLLSD
jgi:signal transduction histidine kinase